MSVSPASGNSWLLREKVRSRLVRYAGDKERGEAIRGAPESRDWKRLSKGRNEGVGLPIPGRDATEGKMLLPGEDNMDPFKRIS